MHYDQLVVSEHPDCVAQFVGDSEVHGVGVPLHVIAAETQLQP